MSHRGRLKQSALSDTSRYVEGHTLKRFPTVVLADRALTMLDDFFVENYLYVVTPSKTITTGALELWGFQGCGVFEKTFVDSNRSLFEAWLATDNHDDFINTFSQKFRGAGITFMRDLKSNCFYILPDLLGEAILYKYEHDGISIFSGDLLEIERIAQIIDMPLTKSLDYSLELTISSNGGLNKSSYVEVSSLDIFEYLIVNSRGSYVSKYRESDDFFNCNDDYHELLEKAQQEILNNVSAAARSKDQRHVAHLTGGFDSRLVLAAAKAAGVSDTFRYYCKGDPVHEDTKIAESAAARVGAIMTRSPGSPANYELEDFGGKMLGPLYLSAGMLSIGPHQGHRETPLTLLSGGYGETFRSFYGVRIGKLQPGEKLSAEKFGKTIWSSYLFSKDGSGLFSGSFVRSMEDKLDSELNKARLLGVQEDDLADFIYLQIRNRYFVGIITTNWNRYINRFDPLYSPSAVKLSFKLSLSERADNIIGYDLMNKFCPELLNVPFDSKKFGTTVSNERGYSAPSDYKFVRPKYDEVVNIPAPMVDTNVLRIPRTTRDDVDYAKTINANAAHVAGRAHVRDSVNIVLRKYSARELENRFNTEELELLRKRPANTRIRIRTLYSLFSSLSWLSDDIEVGRVALKPSF